MNELINTTTDTETPPGPLRLPPPRTQAQYRIAERLASHLTSAQWLPANWFEEIDRARERHLQLREQVADAIGGLTGLQRTFRAEDIGHATQLKQHARGGPEPEDTRTSLSEREQAVSDTLAKVWANAEALADCVDETIAMIKEHEPQWVDDLGQRRLQAEQTRLEAERLLARARVEEWSIHTTASWLMGTAEDSIARGQPAPQPQAPPRDFTTATLSRPWWKQANLDQAS
jgi:hypothetical protein